MAQKLFDVVVKTGSYTNAQGEEKGRYENVGSMMQGDNGQFIILKRTFNPAGVANPDNKDSVILSMFEPNNANQQNQQQQQGGYNQQQQAPQQDGYQQQAPQQQQQQQKSNVHPARPQQYSSAPQGGGYNQGRG